LLQKVTDEPLVDCPACGKARFAKKISAPGFQLKGTGWYETDFKDKSAGSQSADKPANGKGTENGAGVKKDSTATGGKSDSSGSSAASAA